MRGSIWWQCRHAHATSAKKRVIPVYGVFTRCVVSVGRCSVGVYSVYPQITPLMPARYGGKCVEKIRRKAQNMGVGISPTPIYTAGGRPGTRTPNPLIKSQLLCQLS